MPQGAETEAQHVIDACFTVQGAHVPVDHGYALYGALSALFDDDRWLHEVEGVAIHPIRGRYAGNGLLRLTPHSRLTLRLSAELLPQVLPLTGKALTLDGHRLHIGPPQTFLLKSAVALHARLVTTRNGDDEERFDAEIQRQLEALDIAAMPVRGERRTFRVRGKQVVGYSLLVAELTADESLRLQEAGLGGRRKMGCGVFTPWRG